MKRMRTYDVVFILDEKKVEDSGEKFANDVLAQVKSLGGEVKEKIMMGRRQFARPIGKNNSGIYWEFVTDLDPSKVAALIEKYSLNATVLRMACFDYVTPDPRGKAAAAAPAMM